MAGDEGYPGGFVEHYLLSVIYPEGLTQNVQITLGLLVLGVNLGLYGWLIWRTWQPRQPR